MLTIKFETKFPEEALLTQVAQKLLLSVGHMAEDESLTDSSSDPNPNPCPICLAPVIQDSYLDQCFRAHRYRLKCYYTEPGDLADKLRVSRHWKCRKYLQQNHFLPDWLRREIQALMQEEDVDIIVHHILGVIESLRSDWLNNSRISTEMVQKEFRVSVSEAVTPFLTGRTERFVNELELFLASGLNIDAFDRVYIKHLGWKVDEISENDDEEPPEHIPVVSCLYFLDEDSDGN